MSISELSTIYKALSDETRLRLLHLLSYGELCVCDLTAVLGMPQSTVSRHLAYLKNAGLVRDRRETVWMYYSLTEPRGRVHASQIECLRNCFREVPLLREDRKRLRALMKDKNRCA